METTACHLPPLSMSIEEIVRRFTPMVTGVARGVGLTAIEAEDVAQSVWLKLLTRGNTIADPACLPGWLKTCARREAQRASLTRRRCVPSERFESRPPISTNDDPAAELERRESRHLVSVALARLNQRQREVLTAVADGYSYVEISASTGVPVPSIGPTMQRGLRAMSRMSLIAHLGCPEPSAA